MQTGNLQLFCDKHFTEKQLDTIVKKVVSNLLKEYFIDNMISNAQYERDIFKIIQKSLLIEINSFFEKELNFSKDLSIYLFKRYIKKIFQLFSELLLKELATSNKNVFDFLKYYSLDTIVVATKKYKVPQIKTEDGVVWNAVSIISLLKNYIKAKDAVALIEPELQRLDEKQKAFFINGISPIEHNQLIEEKFIALGHEIKQNSVRIDILRDSQELETNEEEIEKTQSELDLMMKKRLQLRQNKDQLIRKKVKQFTLAQYNEVLKEIDTVKKEAQMDYFTIEKNFQTYQSIQNALINALISKKQLLG